MVFRAHFVFCRYWELDIDEEKWASHFIENPSFQHIHHSVRVCVSYCHFVDYTLALRIDLVSMVVQSWKRTVVFRCSFWIFPDRILHDPSASSKLRDQMSNTTRSYFSNGAFGHFARTILHRPFSVALHCSFFTNVWCPFVARMSASCWQKDVRFGHVQKLRSNFYQFWVKLKKNEWHGKNPTKWLWKNCPWSWVPDKVEALQHGSGVFFYEHECKCLTIFGCNYQNRCE